MELDDFFLETQRRVKAETAARLLSDKESYPQSELIFSEIVMDHMSDIGMTEDPKICHYSGKVGASNLRLTGYALSEDATQLDLFVSFFSGSEEIVLITDTQTKAAAQQCVQFLTHCANGKLSKIVDPTNDVFELVQVLDAAYQSIEQVKIIIITDGRAKSKNFKPREIVGKSVGIEVMDIERLHRHWSAGKPRDELTVNFSETYGQSLPCVFVPDQMADYDYALTVIPGEVLRSLYEKFGSRLLEANVRSFLNAVGKVNRGIRDTLKDEPGHFMAYNNGLVLVADDIVLEKNDAGVISIAWLKGLQIVNGGQTTASLYFTKKKSPDVDLSHVRVPAKIIIPRSEGEIAREQLISKISRFANSQNAVRNSDLSANHSFHRDFERFADSVYCPDGVGRWYYERAAGSYNVWLAREGTTVARRKAAQQAIPTYRKMKKSDLAKYLQAWIGHPHVASLGGEKNFREFMRIVDEKPSLLKLPIDVDWYKQTIARIILFKETQKITRKEFSQGQSNIAVYTISMISRDISNNLDFVKIWEQQGVSEELQRQITIWTKEVYEILKNGAGERLLTEYAKKIEAWNSLSSHTFSIGLSSFPEALSS